VKCIIGWIEVEFFVCDNYLKMTVIIELV